ncbi:ABC transporter ATP-binding protein [Alcanivorax sp. N3-2A]|nr:ABC transporter ATP-binding protein [Alcanivorax sp. N3-2A]|tara:strand:+ start:22430 stop:23179 length:750 start_codon:yes stop_codon:yes gene_type:complete
MTSALCLTGVQKRFGATEVLKNVDLDIREGERHALLGPNGAGKSTLFNLISGRDRPSAGSITLFDQEIAGLTPARVNRLGLGRSFQITNVVAGVSVRDNLLLGVMGLHGRRWPFSRRGQAWRRIEESVDEVLERMRLSSERDRLAGDLTYSQQRSLEIGMTLATGPRVILLDEPTAGMSREETSHTIELIEQATAGKTLLIVEHDMEVVFRLADRISVLVYGSVLSTGTPEQIRADARVQEAYLGETTA